MKRESKSNLVAAFITVALIATGAFAIWQCSHNVRIFVAGLERSPRIDVTPEQIQAVREIGQWEFLSVYQEELVDTVRKGIFSNDYLSRIYYGVLRIGIDLSAISNKDMRMEGDTLLVILPAVGLLDENFIDEARTKSFHESGHWQAADRELMYLKAKELMREHALTETTLRNAEENAQLQLRKLLQGMGFKHVKLEFRKQYSL